jgi:hypothetical protein
MRDELRVGRFANRSSGGVQPYPIDLACTNQPQSSRSVASVSANALHYSLQFL